MSRLPTSSDYRVAALNELRDEASESYMAFDELLVESVPDRLKELFPWLNLKVMGEKISLPQIVDDALRESDNSNGGATVLLYPEHFRLGPASLKEARRAAETIASKKVENTYVFYSLPTVRGQRYPFIRGYVIDMGTGEVHEWRKNAVTQGDDERTTVERPQLEDPIPSIPFNGSTMEFRVCAELRDYPVETGVGFVSAVGLPFKTEVMKDLMDSSVPIVVLDYKKLGPYIWEPQKMRITYETIK